MLGTEYIVYIVLTGIFAFVVGVYHNMNHADYIPPKGMLETFRLLKFSQENLSKELLSDNFPSFLLEDQELTEKDSKMKRFLEKYREFRSNKILTYKDLDLQAGEKDGFGLVVFVYAIMSILLIVGSAVFSVFIAHEMTKERNQDESTVLLTHPLDRYNSMMHIIGYIASLLFLILVGLLFVTKTIGIILIIVAVLEILILLFYSFKLIRNQMRWKDDWNRVLDFIMQKGTLENDHDLHNTSFLYSGSVEKYPDIPISQIQRTAVFIFAVLQFLVPKVVENFNLKDILNTDIW